MDNENGLSSQEVLRRRSKYGLNEVPEKRTRFVVRLGKRFWGIVPWMLEITAFITYLLGKYSDTIIVIGLIVFNAVLSLFQERRAQKAMTALKQRLRIQSRVKRDGSWIVIDARELVPGDVVRLRAGDIVPADIRLINGNLSVDQSALTGESVTKEVSGGGLVYSGSVIKRGEATGTVVAIGTHTYFGKTVELLKIAKPKLHMEETTVRVANRLALIVIGSLLVAFVYAILTGFKLAVLLPLAAVLLVGAVPVAMPTMFTLNMALGSFDIANKGVLVTTLSAIEDAAAMDVLCVDKTGTLTMNKLFVEEVLPVNGYQKDDVVLYGALASNEANQDPIDAAFLAAAADYHISLASYSKLEFIPFDPQTRLTGALIQGPDGRFHVQKGSISAIFSSCEMSDKDMEALNAEAESFAEKGLRVIAVARGMQEHGFQLVGLAGIADRIRTDSRKMVKQINDLGMSVKMLTGDSLPIARNIAKQIGLDDDKIIRVTSEVKGPNNQTSLPRSLIEDSSGIAEIYPEEKYTIVKTLQDGGHIVGMTGDGLNDAPALKQAEVGIAVVNATEIAKESASAVLTTEGLDGIITMVKTGRTIYQRILSWVLNMITKKIYLVLYIVAMLFLIHYFMLSVFSMVLLVFLGDFGTMTISTDNATYSMKPESFGVSWLFKVGLVLGILTAIEGVAFTMASFSFFGLGYDINRIYTFGFVYLAISMMLNLMIVRERGHFWKSRPSNLLIITAVIEILIAAGISLFGFLGMSPLGYFPFVMILMYVSGTTFLLNDPVKVYLIKKFQLK